ncbi:MAG: ABC transporter permease [Thaumarchaeota archaeon]|nr:ABC transporter permease [Candidatus Calditenuaceae archaeon]MDW8187497.1 ABC transporter permease [Nitrososphaerota archaeon]
MSASGAWKLLTSTWSGRVGVSLLAAMVVVSALVLILMPPDFGTKYWNDPAYWIELPKAVPPEWYAWFTGSPYFPQTELELRSAGEGAGYVTYVNSLKFDYDALPSHVLVIVRGVRFSGDPPTIAVDLFRPDGLSVPLARVLVPPPSLQEKGPYVRWSDPPLRVAPESSQDFVMALEGWFSATYGLEVGRVSSRTAFAIPTSTGPVPLKGEYVVVARFFGSPGDGVDSVSVVLGGSHYGLAGTDVVGRDLFLGLLYGFPVALGIGAFASVLVTAIGTLLGLLSGYYRGLLEEAIQRVADVVANVPLLPLLVFLSFLLRPSILTIMAILVVFSWPGLTIIVRSMVLQVIEMPFVEAAKAEGAGDLRVILLHVLPQIAPYVAAQMVFFVPSAILAEAGLSFLGLGDPTIPTWGQILELGFRTGAVFTGYWWWVIPPGLLLVLTGVAFASIALGLEPLVNPRLRKA